MPLKWDCKDRANYLDQQEKQQHCKCLLHFVRVVKRCTSFELNLPDVEINFSSS
jgi:hypothetical protein